MTITKGYLSETYLGFDPTPRQNIDLTGNVKLYRIPFISNSMQRTQNKNESAVITGRRAMSRPFFGNIMVDGTINYPLDAQIGGLVFNGLTGNRVSAAMDDLLAATAWTAEAVIAEGDIVVPTIAGPYAFIATAAGTTGLTEPMWDESIGATTADGTVAWQAIELPQERDDEQRYHAGDVVTFPGDAANIYIATTGGVTAGAAPSVVGVENGDIVNDGTVSWIVTEAEGRFYHTFFTNTNPLPYMWVEKALKTTPDDGNFMIYRGAKNNVASLSVGGDGEMTVEVTTVGINAEDPYDDNIITRIEAAAGTADVIDFSSGRVQFQNFQSAVSAFSATDDDAITADAIQTMTIDISNNISEDVRTINSKGFRYDTPEGMVGVSGSITALWQNTKAFQIARQGAPVELAFGVYNDQDEDNICSLQIIFPEVEFTPFDVDIDGGVEVTGTFDYMGYQNNSDAPIRITLVNDIPGEDYEA